MADLFSFGEDTAVAAASEEPAMTTTTPTDETVPPPASSPERERSDTADSFLDLLEEADTSVLEGSSSSAAVMDDKETQDILNWLDEEEGGDDDILNLDSTTASSEVASEKKEETKESKTEDPVSTPEVESATDTTPAASNDDKEDATPATTTAENDDDDDKVAGDEPATDSSQSVEETTTNEATPTIIALPPPEPPKPIVFETLEEALHHPKWTVDQVRSLFVQGGMKVDALHRPQLWCRVVCSGKTVDQVMSSSVADSFTKWQQQTREAAATTQEDDDERTAWIKKESALLAQRIVACDENRTSLEGATQDLCDILLFHYQSSNPVEEEKPDPLLPPVAAALLSAGIPTVVTSVMFTNIMPSFMPLLALTQEERWEAAKSLHSQYYLLACYHLPLLVFHLDRYAPGWHWPKTLGDGDNETQDSATQKGRNLMAQGVVPQSWLISHLAGECGGTLMNPKWLLSLWDLILTSSNNALRFFLALAILEKHSDHLLMLTGQALVDELHRIMEFKEGTTLEGFAIESEDETTDSEAIDWVQEWCGRAQTLYESTPRTVISRLRSAEDNTVRTALLERQRVAEEKLRVRLEAEAKAHREAAEAERDKNAEEARQRLSRSRLVAYYRKYNPEKEKNVDTILKTYEGRLDVLDKKLKAKYGTGFNPALKPKAMPKLSQHLSIMNQGLARKQFGAGKKTSAEMDESAHAKHQVTVEVSAKEVLPIICWSKEGTAKSGMAGLARGRYSETGPAPLKFYLVDARQELAVQEQGRFPTAVSMSPATLLDPDKMRLHEEMFESLRGAVHICIMGGGLSAVPGLYGKKLEGELAEMVAEDDSRTSLCALFFVKKGFPFVSILEGGFVQAHAWLCREGPQRHLNVSSVLVDYDPESFFGRMESNLKLSRGEKAQRSMQNMFDASMTSITKKMISLESLSSELDSTEGRQKVQKSVAESVTKFFAKKDDQQGDIVASRAESAAENAEVKDGDEDAMETIDIDAEANAGAAKKGPVFRNPFAGRRSVAPEKTITIEASAVDFAPVEESLEKAAVAPPSAATSPLSRFTKKDSSTSQESKESKPQPKKPSPIGPSLNRFAGLGASLANSMKNNDGAKPKANNVLKQNPFARFGAKVGEKPSGKPDKEAKEGGKPRFGGIKMNQLKSLSNLRRASQDEDRKSSSTPEVEESISFFSNDDGPGSNTPTEESLLNDVGQSGVASAENKETPEAEITFT